MDNTTKIIIADENAQMRRSMCDGLRRAGFGAIYEASNGEEALELISRIHPAVALLDVWLSKLDGIGVVRGVRSMSFAPDEAPALVVLSMVSNQNVFVEAMNAGAAMCLLKPVDCDSLADHIRSSRTRTLGEGAGAYYDSGSRAHAGYRNTGNENNTSDRRSGTHKGLPVSAHGDPYDGARQ